jgi:hypothetical protein
MAKAYLNKSEELVTNTTAASKYIQYTYLRGPESVSNKISPFRTYFINFLKTDVLLLCKFWSERGISNDAVSGPLYVCMYFDAVVVFVINSSFLFRLALAIL